MTRSKSIGKYTLIFIAGLLTGIVLRALVGYFFPGFPGV
jgi:hypothetical protein